MHSGYFGSEFGLDLAMKREKTGAENHIDVV